MPFPQPLFRQIGHVVRDFFHHAHRGRRSQLDIAGADRRGFRRRRLPARLRGQLGRRGIIAHRFVPHQLGARLDHRRHPLHLVVQVPDLAQDLVLVAALVLDHHGRSLLDLLQLLPKRIILLR